jgi:outer membrane protein
MRRLLLFAIFAIQILTAQAKETGYGEVVFEVDSTVRPPNWYFELRPGYFYFTDSEMHDYFGPGGFSFRAEAGANFWKSLIVWMDAGYFQKEGRSVGGLDLIDFKLGTLTLGLKVLCEINRYASLYIGAGPRLFMMLMHNDSPYVRGDDNAVGIGLGADFGCWIFPIQSYPNFFIDVGIDYSLKTLHLEPDEISSLDSSVDVSGLTGGLGLGIRF